MSARERRRRLTSPRRTRPYRPWPQGINATPVSIGFDRIGRVSDGTTVGQGADAAGRAGGGGGAGVADASRDQPFEVGDPSCDQQDAPTGEAGCEAVAVAALAGGARGDLAGPRGGRVAAVGGAPHGPGAVNGV